MKGKFSLCLSVVVICCLAIPGCSDSDKDTVGSVEQLRITSSNPVVIIGSTFSVALNYKTKKSSTSEPYDTQTNPLGLKWGSSQPGIATVDDHGIVKGIAEGTAVITVSTGDNSVSDQVSVAVYADVVIDELAFITESNTIVRPPQTLQLEIKVKAHFNQYAVAYDTDNNPYGFTWTSTDPGSATVDSHGLVTGLRQGNPIITVTAADGSISDELTLRVYTDEAAGIYVDSPLSGDIIYSKGIRLVRNSVIQGFDIDSRGDIYYCQIAGNDKHNLHIIRGVPNAEYSDYMTFSYFGHGTNSATEETADGKRYVWLGSYGTVDSNGDYSNSHTLARIPYQAGGVYKPTDVEEHFYYPGLRHVHPALDVENDLLAFTSSGGGDNRWFRIYRLSEALALPVESVQLTSQLTYGGYTSPDPLTTETPTIQARLLNKLTPVAELRLPDLTAADGWGQLAFQGFDITPDRIYHYEGEGNANDRGRACEARVTVLDFDGNIVKAPRKVAAISDMDALEQYGITATGYMEAEGIKVHGDKLYLGFASKSTDDVRRAVVLQYDVP